MSPSPALRCGVPAGPARNCEVVLARPTPQGLGECLEINAVTVNQMCPAGFNTTRDLSFTVTALTPRTNLTWRRAPNSHDILSPATGSISSTGTTTVNVQDIVLDSTVTIEIMDGPAVLMSFRLRHY